MSARALVLRGERPRSTGWSARPSTASSDDSSTSCVMWGIPTSRAPLTSHSTLFSSPLDLACALSPLTLHSSLRLSTSRALSPLTLHSSLRLSPATHPRTHHPPRLLLLPTAVSPATPPPATLARYPRPRHPGAPLAVYAGRRPGPRWRPSGVGQLGQFCWRGSVERGRGKDCGSSARRARRREQPARAGGPSRAGGHRPTVTRRHCHRRPCSSRGQCC